jgi:hypothetical protein
MKGMACLSGARRQRLALAGVAVAAMVAAPAARAENPGYTGPTAPTSDVAVVNETLDPSSFSLPPGAQPPNGSVPPDQMIQAQDTGGIDFGDAGLGAAATAGGALLLAAAAYATSRRRRHGGSLSGSDS